MSGHQHATIEDTVYFWFAANDTSGSGGDGSTPLFDVREAGAAAGAIPLLSGTPTLLSHANYPAGCHEVAVAATTGNGFAADDTFAVFCTLAIDSQNPSGFVGSCTLTPLAKASALATVDTVVDGIQTDLSNGTDGLGAIKTDTAAILVDTSTTLDDHLTDIKGTAFVKDTHSLIDIETYVDILDDGTSGNAKIATDVAAILVDTGTNGVLISDGTAAGQIALTAGAIDNVTLVATTTTNSDMRGTDNALLAASINLTGGAVDTVTDVTTKTGYSLSTAGILAIWHQAVAAIVTAGTIGKLLVDEVTSVRMATLTDWINGGRLDVILDTVAQDTTTDIPATITTLQATADAIETDTQDLQAQVGTAGANLTDLGGMSTTMKAQVNTEAKDIIDTDTSGEPAQGAPAATATLRTKIDYLYKNWRNKKEQTATTFSLYDDAGSTVDQKATVSDNGTTAAKAEIVTGP